MAYIRKRTRDGKDYFSVVESYRDENSKVRQRQLQWLGPFAKAKTIVESDYPELWESLMKRAGLGSSATPKRKAREYNKAERNCWKTPDTPEQPVVSLVQQALGGTIGIDPTADDTRSIPANRHITAAENCLEVNWQCDPKTAFMNPPYDYPHLYLGRMVWAVEEQQVMEAIALCKIGVLANQKSGQLIKDTAASFCIWGAGCVARMGFIDADGYQVTGADFDVVLIYWGHNVKRFARTFKAWGAVSIPYR